MDEEKRQSGFAHSGQLDPSNGSAASISDRNLERSTSVAANSNAVKPEVHFNLYSTLGLVYSVATPPVSIGLYLSLVTGEGGFPYFIWGFLVAGVFQLIQMFAQAELASAIPHSTGPAYWIQHLAPAGARRFLGFLIGWLTVAVWWIVVAADCLYLAQLTLATAIALNTGYNPPAWHYYLVYIAWATATCVANLPPVFKILPAMLSSSIFIVNGTAIYLIVALLIRATPKPTAHQVFVEIVNETGWSSNGVVFFFALLPGFLTVQFFESITHITDEVDNPTKQIPQVMIGYGFLSFVTGFAMTIVLSYITVNPTALLDPYGQQPLIQAIFDAARSPSIAAAGSSLVICSLYLASVASFTSWNRLYWSVSRDGILPFSRSMSKLSSFGNIPVNAMGVNWVLVVALGAIQLGSDVAIRAIVSAGSVFVTFIYSVLFGLTLWRGRNFLRKDRWLNLGRFGVPVYVIGMIWNALLIPWFCLPLTLPVTLASMNWGSLVLGGVVAIALTYWIVFRKKIGPSSPSRVEEFHTDLRLDREH